MLLMEGTNIRPDNTPGEPQSSETDIEVAMAATMKATAGMVLIVSSAQNIDRLGTIYRAALRAGRDLVVDLYGASIAKATGNPNIPQTRTGLAQGPRVRTPMAAHQGQERRTVRPGSRQTSMSNPTVPGGTSESNWSGQLSSAQAWNGVNKTLDKCRRGHVLR